MLKRTPEKKKSLGFTSSSPTTGRDFNPGRFLSGLTKAHYPKGFHPSVKAINESIELVDWLIKKHSDDAAAMDLADRLDSCEHEKRCWSAACPCCTSRCPGVHHRGRAQVSHVPPRPDQDCLRQRGPERRSDPGWSTERRTTRSQRPSLERGPRQSWRHLVPRRYGLELQRAQERTLPRVLARAFLRVHGYRRSQEAQAEL